MLFTVPTSVNICHNRSSGMLVRINLITFYEALSKPDWNITFLIKIVEAIYYKGSYTGDPDRLFNVMNNSENFPDPW